MKWRPRVAPARRRCARSSTGLLRPLAHLAAGPSPAPLVTVSGRASTRSTDLVRKFRLITGLARSMCILPILGNSSAATAQELLHLKDGSYCLYTGQGSLGHEVYTFSSDDEARGVLRDMLRHVGMGSARLPFELHAASIPNAVAYQEGSRRMILYNQRFMQQIRDRTDTDWSMVAVLAHEVGHHVMGHTLIPGGSRPPTELEADKFSGFTLSRMGASMEEAVAVFNLFPDAGSDTHPGRRARVAAVTNGWIEATELAEKDGRSSESESRSRPSSDPETAQLGRNVGELTATDQRDDQNRSYDEWWYRASAGEVLTVSASSDDFDTYLVIFGPNMDNKPMASDDDSGSGTNSKVTVRFDQSDRHRLLIRPYTDGEWGKYELSLSSQVSQKQQTPSTRRRLPIPAPGGEIANEEVSDDFAWQVVFYSDPNEYFVTHEGRIMGRGTYGGDVREVGERVSSNDPRFAWLYVIRLGPTYGITAEGQVIGTDMYRQPIVIGHVVQLP